MLMPKELASIARARLKHAAGLFAQGRYDGAAYVCGYAVEIALKARIVKTVKWPGFPTGNSEFSGLQSFKSHNLKMLLYMSGWKDKLQLKLAAEWSVILRWTPKPDTTFPV